MGKTTTLRTISQEAFDELVKENIDDLGMEPDEALKDAIETLTLQGVDLSGIVTSVPGESNPVIECLERLRRLESEAEVLDELVEVFDKLNELCGAENANANANAAIATKNGGVELACSLCTKIPRGTGSDLALLSTLNATASLLHDVQSTGTFQKSNGPRITVGILNDNKHNIDVLNSGFRVVASAATGDEMSRSHSWS
ncbi:hypothetical protein SESBI_34734 [Sesbania bispinosa]|nr:hypothetical protein SESBI_34734 [Sesbania bispinosa]